MPDIIDGLDAIVDEVLSYQKVNKIKNAYTGTSFPSNPATGVRCWRTDLRGYFLYDGTNWVLITGNNVRETKTGSYVITLADQGKTIIMNSATDKIFTLPSIAASDNFMVRLGSIGTGRVTFQSSDTDIIYTWFGNSSAPGTAYNSLNQYFLVRIEQITTTGFMLIIEDGSDGWILT